jgi:hypothetical protein
VYAFPPNPQAVQTLVSQFLFFYTYEFIKRKLKSSGRKISAFDNVLVGMLAGSVNVLVTQPLDTYVTMKQSNTLTRVTKKEKPRSYYAALGPSLFLSVNPGLQVRQRQAQRHSQWRRERSIDREIISASKSKAPDRRRDFLLLHNLTLNAPFVCCWVGYNLE